LQKCFVSPNLLPDQKTKAGVMNPGFFAGVRFQIDDIQFWRKFYFGGKNFPGGRLINMEESIFLRPPLHVKGVMATVGGEVVSPPP